MNIRLKKGLLTQRSQQKTIYFFYNIFYFIIIKNLFYIFDMSYIRELKEESFRLKEESFRCLHIAFCDDRGLLNDELNHQENLWFF